MARRPTWTVLSLNEEIAPIGFGSREFSVSVLPSEPGLYEDKAIGSGASPFEPSVGSFCPSFPGPELVQPDDTPQPDWPYRSPDPAAEGL
jgi:hypothetical protein